MRLHKRIEEELKGAKVEVDIKLAAIAGVLSLVGGFFFGYAFTDLNTLYWSIPLSIAAMFGGLGYSLYADYHTGKALRKSIDTILKVSEEIQETQLKVFGVRGGENQVNWANGILDKVKKLEGEVEALRKEVKAHRHPF